MNPAPPSQGDVKVIEQDKAPTFWQPTPANGFVRNLLNQAATGSRQNFSMGTQTVAAGCMVREHAHDAHEELIYVTEGAGFVRIDGVDYPIQAGSAVFLGLDHKHHFDNPGPGPLTFVWFFMPGGLDGFFEQIGRPRTPGDPAPEPFSRPDNIGSIEASTVFGWTDPAAGKKD
jgi:quercetin dioxygenase-like cupin family protein